MFYQDFGKNLLSWVPEFNIILCSFFFSLPLLLCPDLILSLLTHHGFRLVVFCRMSWTVVWRSLWLMVLWWPRDPHSRNCHLLDNCRLNLIPSIADNPGYMATACKGRMHKCWWGKCPSREGHSAHLTLPPLEFGCRVFLYLSWSYSQPVTFFLLFAFTSCRFSLKT